MSRNNPRGETVDNGGGGGHALLGLLLGLAATSATLLVWQTFTPEPVHLLGLTADRLSAALTLLVAGVGAVTFRFSLRYLDGEPRRRRFLRLLVFTVGSAYLFMLSTNLLLLFVAWSLTSLGLHELLTFYPDRPEAWPPARKKFLISRLGDLALIAAIGVIWRDFGTLDLNAFLAAAATDPGGGSGTAVGLLVAVAALTKSAQFPFHSWLPETMESPTPVSALMHAGIINAGGALVLRFAPLVARVPEALVLLAAVGTLTFVLGTLAMWAQVKVKRTLAWSTVSQMGFMMVQCGVAAFPAALLHILGHGCYKAWSFLRSGGLPAAAPAAPTPPVRALTLAAVGTGLAVPALALASRATSFAPLDSPGELALAAVGALSVGQVWVALLGTRPATLARAVGALAATAAVPALAFGLYRGTGAFLAPVLGELPRPGGPLAWAAAVIPVAALAALAVLHAVLPALGRSAAGRVFYVHALHGFYLGAAADRVVDGIWRRVVKGTKEVEHG